MDNVKDFRKKNSFRFLAVMYLMDFSWLLLIYNIANGKELNYDSIELSAIIAAGLQTSIAIAMSYWVVNHKFYAPIILMSQGTVKKIVHFSMVLNIINLYFQEYYSRYQVGQLAGIFGLYYVMSLGLNVAAFSLLLRRNFFRKDTKLLMIFHSVSMFARVDGIAETLTIISMIYIYMIVCRVNMKIFGLLMIIFSLLAVLYGVQIKLGENFTNNYLIEYMPMWTVERLGIHSYQWGEVLSNASMIKDVFDFISIAWNSFLLRFDLLCGCNLGLNSLPKSVSEAMYYDLYGFYGSGSSPGVMTSISLMGPLGLFVIYWNGVIAKLIFRNIEFKFSHINMIALGVIYKILYVDLSEYLAIISPVVIIFVIIFLVSFVRIDRIHNNH